MEAKATEPRVAKVASRGAALEALAAESRTIVVKVGTSSILSAETGFLALSTLAKLVETLTALRKAGNNVVLVSSGAVGVGCQRMQLKKRPTALAELQAMAAIGQPHLMRYYDELFSALGQPIAQVLLSAAALDSHDGYRNLQATFSELLRLGIIPVVNENDSVAVSELRFGDNDTLSAMVAILVHADHVFLATDVDALYTANPNVEPAPGEEPARPIREVHDVTAALQAVEAATSNSGSQWGTGGIATKLRAAQLASAAGITTVIMGATQPEVIPSILAGSRDVGTVMLPASRAVRSRKRWIMSLPVRGSIRVDAGAARAVRGGSSLFGAGVRSQEHIDGSFGERDAVRILDESGVDFARAVVNYHIEHARMLCGQQSTNISEIVGFEGPEELASRRNIVLLDQGVSERSDT